MVLSKNILQNIAAEKNISVPKKEIFDLPEKILQFGTGVLLRGLPDYFIDKANKNKIFNGRVVVIKSTATGDTAEFEKQDNLYTLCIKGINNNETVNEIIINAAISRVLSAQHDWKKILACAANPEMKIIISNTTEAGIVLTDDKILDSPLVSFPGKLLAFLFERFKIFEGDITKGFIIIPTELIPENGKKLQSIIIELSQKNKLGKEFIEWLKDANEFCNSLVDRIVPGKLAKEDQYETETYIGYEDELMIMAEPYCLWAIETLCGQTKEILSFSKTDDGVIITSDINKYRELKLRLLNGSHTFCCGLAVLAGFTTVKEAMEDKIFYNFIKELMLNEICKTVVSDEISEEDAVQFSNKVLDRFSNPFLEHAWLAITLQYTLKMRTRNIPSVIYYTKKFHSLPQKMIFGFACYLFFMRTKKQEGNFTGMALAKEYVVKDDFAENLYDKWKLNDTALFVHVVLCDEKLWGTDLSKIEEFENLVKKFLGEIMRNGVYETMKKLVAI